MQVTLIVLFAHWCPKCNMMMPVVDEIEEVYKEQLEVVRIDIEKETEIYICHLCTLGILHRDGAEISDKLGTESRCGQ